MRLFYWRFDLSLVVVCFGVSSWWVAGGSPAATHFSCFAKKSEQKKATAKPLPFGFPFVQIKKWEENETRFAQTAFTSLSIFCPVQTAASERVKFNCYFNFNFNFKNQ